MAGAEWEGQVPFFHYFIDYVVNSILMNYELSSYVERLDHGKPDLSSIVRFLSSSIAEWIEDNDLDRANES
jgi:hypothetical protein